MHELARTGLTTLSDKQAEFVRQCAHGQLQTRAAELAGYTVPGSEATRLMRLPHVVAAIRMERDRHFVGELGALAVNTIRDLLTNEDTPAHVRFQAAKYTLGVAGHVEKTGRNGGQEKEDKPLCEMTEAELADVIAKGRQEVAVLEAEVETVGMKAQERARRADGGE